MLRSRSKHQLQMFLEELLFHLDCVSDPRDVDRRPTLGSWGPHWGHPWWFSHSPTSCLGWVVGDGGPRLFQKDCPSGSRSPRPDNGSPSPGVSSDGTSRSGVSTLTSLAGSIPEPSGARVTKKTSQTTAATGTAHPAIDQLPLDMFKDNRLHRSSPGRKTNRLWFRSGVWMPPGTTLTHRQGPEAEDGLGPILG